jgi:hypothetical protein
VFDFDFGFDAFVILLVGVVAHDAGVIDTEGAKMFGFGVAKEEWKG